MTKKTLCPNCGVWHAIEDEPKANTFENRVRRPFRTDALMPTMPQPPGIITEQPTGLPGWDSHVRIPLRQAMISGLLDAPIWFAVGAGGTGILLVVVDAMPVDVAFTPMGLLVISGSVGAIAGLVAFCQTAKKEWPVRLGYYDALLWIEEVTGLDLDGDGEVGEPEAETSVLRIELQDQQGRPRLIADLDTDQERFTELARLVVLRCDFGYIQCHSLPLLLLRSNGDGYGPRSDFAATGAGPVDSSAGFFNNPLVLPDRPSKAQRANSRPADIFPVLWIYSPQPRNRNHKMSRKLD